MLRREKAPKPAAYSVLLYIYDAPSETHSLYIFWPHCHTHTWWGREMSDTVTILWFYKNKWLHIRESSSFMSGLWEFRQWALSTCLPSETTYTRETLLWPRYMGTAPAKTCRQLGDANLRETVFLLLTTLPKMPLLSAGYCTPRPAPVTCLHPSSGLFVPASASELADLARVPTQLVGNQDTGKLYLVVVHRVGRQLLINIWATGEGKLLNRKTNSPEFII